jgi:hypothetical protein
MAGDEQYEDVAGAELLFDLPLPVVATKQQSVEPEIDRAVLDRRSEIAGHKREPFDFALSRMLRLVSVSIADDDERLSGFGWHGGFPSRACQHPPVSPRVKADFALFHRQNSGVRGGGTPVFRGTMTPMRLFYGGRPFVPGVMIVFAARRCGANGPDSPGSFRGWSRQ